METDRKDGMRRAELSEQPIRKLRQLALTAGAAEALIERCLDNEAPKVGLIDLLLKLEMENRIVESGQLEALHAELSQQPMRDVRQRAVAAGAPNDEIDDALDHDEPKAAMIKVIFEAERPKPEPEREPEPEPELEPEPEPEPGPEPEPKFDAH